MLCDYLCLVLDLPKQKETACYKHNSNKSYTGKITEKSARARSQAVGNSGVNETLYCFYPGSTGANQVYIDKYHILACCKVQTVFAGRNSWPSFVDTKMDY